MRSTLAVFVTAFAVLCGSVATAADFEGPGKNTTTISKKVPSGKKAVVTLKVQSGDYDNFIGFLLDKQAKGIAVGSEYVFDTGELTLKNMSDRAGTRLVLGVTGGDKKAKANVSVEIKPIKK